MNVLSETYLTLRFGKAPGAKPKWRSKLQCPPWTPPKSARYLPGPGLVPASLLTAAGGVSLGGTVRDLAQDGKTMFLAAQEMQFAREMSDMVAFLNKRTVLKTGPSEQVFGTPAETRTQESLMQIMEAGQ